jgi:hypothetical protein
MLRVLAILEDPSNGCTKESRRKFHAKQDKYLIPHSDYAMVANMPSAGTCSHQNQECRNNMSDYCASELD